MSILYIVFVLFSILSILYICTLFFIMCPVAVILFHCGATVTKIYSSYVQTYMAMKLILILINVLF